MTERKFLSPPPAQRKNFPSNFISGSIVELRYPTIITFDDDLAARFASKIRKQFPNFSKSFSASFAETGFNPGKTSYSFESRAKGVASVALHDSAMNFRVSRYQSYEEFRKTLLVAVEALVSLLDTDFYTRVGYRIINAIPIPKDSPLEGYLNPNLLTPLQFDVLGSLISSKFEFRGLLGPNDHYMFKYGSPDDQPMKFDEMGNLQFMLDYDYFSEDVDVKDCIDKIDFYHDRHFDFFWWALESKSKQLLEPEQ